MWIWRCKNLFLRAKPGRGKCTLHLPRPFCIHDSGILLLPAARDVLLKEKRENFKNMYQKLLKCDIVHPSSKFMKHFKDVYVHAQAASLVYSAIQADVSEIRVFLMACFIRGIGSI